MSLGSLMFAALARAGAQAPDIVFPNGGGDSYWHNRSDGAWATYVTHEVIPAALSITHADPTRIAIGGISMGGFGALDIARLDRGRFCAIGGHSAAIWASGADSAAGAFDDAADFHAHDLLREAASADPYGQTPLWLDVGAADPFRVADETLAQDLRSHGANVRLHIWSGGHGPAYWDRHWDRTVT